MNLLAPIIVIPFILIAAIILFLCVAGDIESAKKYKNAYRSTGKIIKQLDNYKITAYGSGIFGMHRRIYHQYEVEYQADGKTCMMVLQTKKKGLSAGDTIEVRYVIEKNTREAKGVTCIHADRIKELVLGSILGFILAIGIIIFLDGKR